MIETNKKVVWLNNPFDIADHDVYEVKPGQTIQDWVNENGGVEILNVRPTICYYNGKQIMRDDYKNITIEKSVAFITLPEGGKGGSNPLQIVAMVAIAVLAVYTGGAAAAMYGGATTVAGATASAVTVMAVNMAGAAIMSAIIGPPEAPNNSMSQPSPTYSLQAQGNAARIGAAIPVIYGTNRIYPDFAAQPYAIFEGNNQYLHQLFVIGQGDIDVSKVLFEDTSVDNFDADIEVVKPNKPVTLFHSAVIQASTAGGQGLESKGTQGPYVIGGPKDTFTKLAADVVFPGGLMTFNDEGDEKSASVGLQVIAEVITDKGIATGGTVILYAGTVTRCTRTAQRLTFSQEVPEARYQIKFVRTTGKGGSKTTDALQIGSVKGFKKHDNKYGDLTLLAIKVRANENLSNAASRKINCIAKGKIREWTQKNGWSNPVYSSNPAWVFADVCRARYGGNYEDGRIDLLGLEQLAAKFKVRKDSFNGIFDSQTNISNALKKVSQVVRSTPVKQGNLIRMIRDQRQQIPSTVFSHANIKDFSIDFVMHGEESSDSIRAMYFDSETGYKQGEVLCKLPGSSATKPKELMFFGITNRAQAWREGIYHISSSTYRRSFVNFKTEMEGYIPSYGDVVLVNHYLLNPDAMFSGLVIYQKDSEITLSVSIGGDVGDMWLMSLRDDEGRPSKAIRVTKISDNVVKANETLPFVPNTNPNNERTHFVMGKGNDWAARVKIIGVEPGYDDQIKISGVIEDDRVHEDGDEGQIPGKTFFQTMSKFSPVIVGLSATQGGTKRNPMIYVHWADVQGIKYYEVEASFDAGTTWQPMGKPVEPNIQFRVPPGSMIVRVAANAKMRGKWEQITLNAGAEFSTPKAVVINLDSPFTGKSLKASWAAEPSAIYYRIQMIYKGALLRELYQEATKTSYEYTHLMGANDGAGRVLTIKVCAQNANEVQGPWTEFTATNPPPPKIPSTAVYTEGFMDAVMLKLTYSAPADFDQFVIHGSTNKGFPVTIANIIAYDRSSNPSFNVPTKAGFYIRIAAADVWGIDGLNYSDEIKIENIRDVINEIKGSVTEEFLDEALKEDIQAIRDKAGLNASAITRLEIVDTNTAKEIKDIKSVNAGQQTSLTEVNKSVDGIEAMKAVVIDNNGTVSGYKLVSKMNDAGTPVSQMSFAVDKFFVVDPANKNSLPFVIDTKTKSVVIGDTLIRDGSIVADKLSVTNLSAITANLGTVTSGTFTTGNKDSGNTYAVISNSDHFPLWIGQGEKNDANAVLSISDTGYLKARGQIECEEGKFLLGQTTEGGYTSLNGAGELHNYNYIVERDGTLKAQDAQLRNVHLEGSLDAQNISVNALNSTITGANIVGKTIIADMFIGPIGDFKEAHLVANNYYYGPNGKIAKGLWISSNPSGSIANIKGKGYEAYLKSPTSAKYSGSAGGGGLGTYTAILDDAYSAITRNAKIVKGRLKSTSVSCSIYLKLNTRIKTAVGKGHSAVTGKYSTIKIYSGATLLGQSTIPETISGTFKVGPYNLQINRVVTGGSKAGATYGPIEVKGTITIPFAKESSNDRIKLVLVAESNNNTLRINTTYLP
ncbi:hypothetical protein JK628_03060 [Shewanella sp. KX20019]|uniref:host specificity factor TipJ family phage tail protein n=1 Tax=Shewanella sp. KX20019 TaxID=2803864 RepID=UPI0019255614|nr:host specificity factor TipJ family phage tail protein [Shewanella sp. KX20019]QQX80870.1 hypothetical protein JK628_03060 [Shewanella sp. KX20019]